MVQVFVVLRTDITPEVRLDHGGGEIGSTEVESVHLNKENAEYEAAYSAFEKLMELIEDDPAAFLPEEDPQAMQDLADWLDYSYRWDIEEKELKQ